MLFLDIHVRAVLLRIDRNPIHHGTLGAVRSLGGAGVEVHAVAEPAGSPVRGSRFLHATHPPSPPGASAADVVSALLRVAARSSRPAVIIPMDDASAVAASRGRSRLSRAFLMPHQPGALAERGVDKTEPASVCASADVPHPLTLVPDSPAQAATAAWRLGLRVVAKWSRPWLPPAGTELRGTDLVRSPQEARTP